MKLYQLIRFISTFSIFSLPMSLGYIKLNIDSERNLMCNKRIAFGPFAQNLKHHDNSGLIVEDHLRYHAQRWKEDLHCSFKVNYPTGSNGVIAVIQSIKMRKNERTGECIDSIRFRSKDGAISDEFCGNFNVVSKMNGQSSTLDGINYGNSFRTKGHNMHVDVVIGNEPFIKKNEEIEFKVVFTAYKNCSEGEVLDISYKPCRESSNFCIYNGFFNDNYVNCPLPGCVDEGTCSKFIAIEKSPSVGTKLLVSSISFLFVLFVTFLISIWACKKHKVVCFSEQFSHPDRSRQTRVIEMNEQQSSRSGEIPHSASVPPIELDKDLPPKYEDLFPDR